MADMADMANRDTEFLQMHHLQKLQEDRQVEAEKLRRAPRICLNCEEPLEPGSRFCDKDCSEDYERRVVAHRTVWG